LIPRGLSFQAAPQQTGTDAEPKGTLKTMLSTTICALFGFFCQPGQAPVQSIGKPAVQVVIGAAVVLDGDSLRIGTEEVRLLAIDAPEMAQKCGEAGREWPCGIAARRRVTEIIGGKAVMCSAGPGDVRDLYGRFLGFCTTADGLNINAEMVRSGYARAFTRYNAGQPYQAAYEAAEAEARQLRRGIWSGPHQAPWDFRAMKRGAE
jgi:endonuclease YncB( thermonuclease family)